MTSSRNLELDAQPVRPDRRPVRQPTRTDPARVIATLARMLARAMGSAVDLRTTFDPSAGDVSLDPDQLEQIVLHLALNARDAMPQGGRLELVTAARTLSDPVPHRHGVVASGDYVVIAVRDNGAGLNETALVHIFEPFSDAKRGDTGHGLSRVYGIVKQAGGHLIVNSTVGAGTTIDVYLPRRRRA